MTDVLDPMSGQTDPSRAGEQSESAPRRRARGAGAATARRAARSVAANLPALVFWLGLIGLWEWAARRGSLNEFVLPRPSKIWDAIIENRESLWRDSKVTLKEILAGYAAGSLVGFLMGVGIFYSSVIRRILYPFALLTQTIPKVALAPLFIVWFGVGFKPIFLITALICLFPVLINTVVGLDSVDDDLIELSESLSATGLQRFWMLRLPAALPTIAAGLEVSISLAVVGALVGEFIASSSGLGYQILIANSQLRTPELYAALTIVAVMGIVLFSAVKVLEHLLLGRRHNRRSGRVRTGTS